MQIVKNTTILYEPNSQVSKANIGGYGVSP